MKSSKMRMEIENALKCYKVSIIRSWKLLLRFPSRGSLKSNLYPPIHPCLHPQLQSLSHLKFLCDHLCPHLLHLSNLTLVTQLLNNSTSQWP
jgi:hypothetical protein